MENEKLELLKLYKEQCSDEEKAIIEVAIDSLVDGVEPELPVHIKNSLLLKEKKMLKPSIDFEDEAMREKLQEAEFQAKYDAIGSYIYSFYSALKQSQDSKWVDSYTTKLKAAGVVDLEKSIVEKTEAFLTGSTLDECVSDIEDATQKEMYLKLIKVAVRTQWAEDCIAEGKAAIAEDREPNYPPFPEV